MLEESREPFWTRCGDSTPRDRRNLKIFIQLCLAWALCFLGASMAISRELLPDGPVSWLVATVPSLLLAGVVAAYVRYLRDADEMQRGVHYRAIAVGFASGFFVLCGYPPFERLGAPAMDPGVLVSIMAVSYSLAIVVNTRRYG